MGNRISVKYSYCTFIICAFGSSIKFVDITNRDLLQRLTDLIKQEIADIKREKYENNKTLL